MQPNSGDDFSFLEVDDWSAEDWEAFWAEPPEPEEEYGDHDDPTFLDLELDPLLDDPESDQIPSSSSPAERTFTPQNTSFSEGDASKKERDPKDLEGAFWRNYDEWTAVQAAKVWRDNGKPQESIRFVRLVAQERPSKIKTRARSALLTTFGASLLDLDRPASAFSAAKTAIQIDETHWHPFRVAGAACRRLNAHDHADWFFKEAERLAQE